MFVKGFSEMFRPKLFSISHEFTREKIVNDIIAGILVGIVALPLGIAFGIASGVTPEKGLITAIIGGFIVSFLGGSRVQIGGPTGAFIVIVYGIVVVYNSLRLIVGEAIFVEREESILKSLKESWIQTKGNLWDIVVPNHCIL